MIYRTIVLAKHESNRPMLDEKTFHFVFPFMLLTLHYNSIAKYGHT